MVRNQGVLSYQFVVHRDGRPITSGQVWNKEELSIYPEQSLKTSKILRDRGIKVVFATFTELKPGDDVIASRIEHWSAEWKRDAEINLATNELNAMRIINQARVRARRDMVYTLNDILKSSQYSEEASAVRLYQALETVATNPTTRQFVTGDMLRALHTWLLPEDSDGITILRSGASGDEGGSLPYSSQPPDDPYPSVELYPSEDDTP
jgi:hypothetical protein